MNLLKMERKKWRFDLHSKFHPQSAPTLAEVRRNMFPAQKPKESRQSVLGLQKKQEQSKFTHTTHREKKKKKVRTMWSLKSEEVPYSGDLSPIRRRRSLQLLIFLGAQNKTLKLWNSERERERERERAEGFAGFYDLDSVRDWPSRLSPNPSFPWPDPARPISLSLSLSLFILFYWKKNFISPNNYGRNFSMLFLFNFHFY